MTRRCAIRLCTYMQEEAKLLVANAAKFNKWFNISVLENTEVTAINRKVCRAFAYATFCLQLATCVCISAGPLLN